MIIDTSDTRAIARMVRHNIDALKLTKLLIDSLTASVDRLDARVTNLEIGAGVKGAP